MIKTKEVEAVWNPTTRTHYENLGYPFTKYKDKFIVPIEHLLPNSNADIIVECEYCFKEIPRAYGRHMELYNSSIIKKDACQGCRGKKRLEEIEFKQKNGSLTEDDRGYWMFKENRLKALHKHIIKYGNANELRSNKEGKLLYGRLKEFKDSIEEMIQELGYDLDIIRKNKSKDYYNDIKNVLNKINEFVKTNNRFPQQKEIVKVLKIGQRYIDKHGGIYELKRKLNYFDENDLVDNRMFVNGSMLEFVVSQFLIYHNVDYNRERLVLPNSKHKYRYDFYLIDNDLYTEVWGYEENSGKYSKNYYKRRKIKEKIYRENDLKLLSIEHDDINIHNPKQIIETLIAKFSPYINIKNDIPEDIFISSKTISDDDIYNEIIKHQEMEGFLPKQQILINNDLGHLTRLIRMRHGSYFKFAQKYNMKIHGKNIDIDKKFIFDSFKKIIKLGKDITKKNIKKLEYSGSIFFWLQNNGQLLNNKLEFFKHIIDENIDMPKQSLMFLFNVANDLGVNIRNEVTFEQQNFAKWIIEKLSKNQMNYSMLNKIEKKYIESLPLSDEDYKSNFMKVTNESFKLTPIGFDEYSNISYRGYINHFEGKTWLDIIKDYGKFDEYHKYILEEYRKYMVSTGEYNLDKFTQNHPYIRITLIEYQDRKKWLEEANVEVKKKRYEDSDLKDNFLNLVRQLNRIPLFHEFVEMSEIKINTYAKRLKLVGKWKVYDEVVKLYCSQEEYEHYLKEKLIHKSEVGKVTGALSRKHSDEDLRQNFITIFTEYINTYGNNPPKRKFIEISPIDESTYRKRLGMKWSEVVEYYGLSQNAI